MLRHPSATPCPVIPSLDSHSVRQDALRPSRYSSFDDETANIDFTSALPRLGAGLKNVKPRRLGNVKGKENAPDFAIHEDGEVCGAGVGCSDQALKRAVQRQGSAMARAPQRPKQSVPFSAPAPILASSTTTANAVPVRPSFEAPKQSASRRRLSQAPRRPVTVAGAKAEIIPPATTEFLPSVPEATIPVSDPTLITLPKLEVASTTMLKPVRRGTIYIPTEDTTMPSMYMGMFSPLKDLAAAKMTPSYSSVMPNGPSSSIRDSNPPTRHPMDVDIEVTGIAAQMLAKKHRPLRTSIIGRSPKRGPLNASSRNLQETAVTHDRWGQGGGKENVPPGSESYEVADKNIKSMPVPKPMKRISILEKESKGPGPMAQPERQQVTVSRLFESTASSAARVSDQKRGERANMKRDWNAGSRLKTTPPISSRSATPEPKSKPISPKGPETEAQGRKPAVPSRFIMPKIEAQSINEIYPILTDNLANLSMYEDNWLNHQEIAITQLVNNLFSASTPTRSSVDIDMLRIRLLEKYGKPENAMLYKRLQAALMYGALSVPSEILRGATRLSCDLGKRRAFTDLWLDTYDLACLRAALEVVTGRHCANSPRSSSSSGSTIDNGQGVSRRGLQAFIEAFLIRNEDGKPDESLADQSAWSYQRTLLRSLMLIKLLDGMKTTADRLLSTCLFQPTSEHKSSEGIVKALFQQLNPSAGDPIRALSHIGYTVAHSQYPLEEYSYQIDNIAIDLRDGVRLTRLVEILLYPFASQSLEHLHDTDSTTTVLLPSGELLSMAEGERDWPLSQHLKFPCAGRITKLYNVQLALSALQGVKGMTALVQEVKAEDIVDGYREKTVKLLWGLTSKWGLSGLVDWDDVEREIKRLGGRANVSDDNDLFDLADEKGCALARQKASLKSWAQAIADQRGITVKNLTTSFADGRVFEAIVDEYEPYLTCNYSSPGTRSLSARLRRLGCSGQFAMLFSSSETCTSRGNLFDPDFVLAALAFLCSRLLGSTKGARAAVAIQRAWRSCWARKLVARKIRLKAVAEDCAAALRSRGNGKQGDLRLHNDTGAGNGGKAALVSEKAGIQIPAMTVVDDIWLDL